MGLFILTDFFPTSSYFFTPTNPIFFSCTIHDTLQRFWILLSYSEECWALVLLMAELLMGHLDLLEIWFWVSLRNVYSLVWEDPLEKGMATHSNILAWKIPWTRRAWWATVHGVTKSWTWLSDFYSLTHFSFAFLPLDESPNPGMWHFLKRCGLDEIAMERLKCLSLWLFFLTWGYLNFKLSSAVGSC